ncbi:hypothetical protein BGZ63DRAFT_485166 [Mariannaea sp. PMI_226]|nr:hypothetical protein BGZ63DRAFT_485166 [Mariannaea sp. PMI_226]
MYQSTAISSFFTTQGYLIPIISVLAVPILPRSKFIQSLILNLLFICLGAAMSLLAIWSSVQARIHTSAPPSQSTSMVSPPYNSSQSAVCAIWLFANIWFVNLLRAKVPSLNIPVVIYCIFINNSTTFGPRVDTTMAAEKFVREQLVAMLFGMGLAAGVSLFIFPISSRMVVFAEFKSLIGLLRKMVALQKKILAELTTEQVIASQMVSRRDFGPQNKHVVQPKGDKAKREDMSKHATATKCLRDTADEIKALVRKIDNDISYAKRDMAWGSLDAKDLSEILAMDTIMDILQRVTERGRWIMDNDIQFQNLEESDLENQMWTDLMKEMKVQFQTLSEASEQGLEHAGIRLQITTKPKACERSTSNGSNDVEANGDQIKTGDEGFANLLDKKLWQFYSQQGEILRTLVSEPAPIGGELKSTQLQHSSSSTPILRNRTRLYIAIYLQHLMRAVGEAIQELVAFGEEKIEDGTMRHKHFIFPCEYLIWKWLRSIFKEQKWSAREDFDILEITNGTYRDAEGQKRDLEHLPAANAWQQFGNGLRKISSVLGSKESTFGFRVACATLTVGIMAFLEQTQEFFHHQRLDWAMITIALGMTITSGQSVFGFCCRVGGTCAAMVFSLIIWYIVDQKTPGVIVFLWLFIFIEHYGFRYPKISTAVMITIITQIIIIGYELQVRQLGKSVATASGQPYYPIYLLAPYRLAVVTAGSLIAFFWTIFPSPMTDRTWLRQELSTALYLLASYCSVLTSTMKSQVEATAGQIKSETCPVSNLAKARRTIFIRFVRFMSSIKSHIMWQQWEPTIGGQFPVEAYQEIIMHSERVMGYLTLIGYSLTHLCRMHQEKYLEDKQLGDKEARTPLASVEAQDDRWRQTLLAILPGWEPAYQAVMSTLTLSSNSLLSGRSLPPFPPLTSQLERLGITMQPTEDSSTGERDQIDSSLLAHRSFPNHHEMLGPATTDSPREGGPVRISDRLTEQESKTKSKQAGIIQKEGTDVLDSHWDSRNYTDFIAMQVCSVLVYDDIEGIVQAVSGLVGIVDLDIDVWSSSKTGGAP